VLLFGVLGFGGLFVLELLPGLDLIYVWPSAPPKPGLFEALGPAVRLWFILLAVAVVFDFVGTRLSRQQVRPFASAMNAGQPSDTDPVVQVSEGNATSTSGKVGDRSVTATLSNTMSRTGPIFRVDVACNCPLVLEINHRNLVTSLLGLAGAVVATGDPDLDAVVIIQGDDEQAIRRWLAHPTVRQNVLQLFEQHNMRSVSLCDGSILSADLIIRSMVAPPKRDADAIVKILCALAETLERCSHHESQT
jgi:hypothetical protein